MTGRNPPGGAAPTTAALAPGALGPRALTPGTVPGVPGAGAVAGVLVAPPSATSRKPNRETRREPSRKYRKQGMS
ncbi:hypothetical protein SHIRM173S_03666 [Streptomyces hirsutus]